MVYTQLSNIYAYSLSLFEIKTLCITSKYLKKNPLNDSHKRFNLILKPKDYSSTQKYKLLVVLSGFSSNGTKYFAHKPFAKNYPQVFDEWCESNRVKDCIVVFVDAFTFWGGSQFINSPLVGNYEDYIVKELMPAIQKEYSISDNLANICVSGGSSGGYGALHLASKYPNIFGKAAAIAPDCDFNLSLMPEIFHALPLIEKWGGINSIKGELKQGRFFSKRNAHLVINVIAMAYCYSSSKKGLPKFPFNPKTGEIISKEWSSWLKHDPIFFLKKRKSKVEKLKGIYLEVGKYDQFNLQYGARKLNSILKKMKLKFKYQEFSGNHFDISKQRPNVWKWFLEP